MYRKLFVCFAWLVGSGFLLPNNRKPHVFLVGDSTVATLTDRHAPMAGWGQVFQEFFTDEVRVDNRALSGKSSRSFIEEGKWGRVTRDIRAGDYVLIQFGHNDQKRDHRYTDPYGTYQKFLTQYIHETRQKGGIPILVTSVMRRRYTKEGKLYDTHGNYPKAVRQLAARLEVPLIDLHQRSFEYLDRLGQEATKRIFLWLLPGQEKNYPRGIEDNTHFSGYGAREVGKLVVEGIQALDLPLKNHLKGCSSETRETLTICAGDSVRIGDAYRKRAGIYRTTTNPASGCQTTRVTTLRVAAVSSSFQSLILCQGERVELGGEFRTESGTYYDTYQNRAGCDSVVTTQLMVRTPPDVRRSLTICSGDSARIGDHYRTTVGTYRHTQSTDAGCPQTVVTALEVLSVRFSQQSFLISEGDSVWTGQRFRRQPGTFYDTLRSTTGCDSVVTTILQVAPAAAAITNSHQLVTLCAGDSLWAGGGYRQESGTFYDTLFRSGTKQVMTTTTEVLPGYRTEQTVALCSGERVWFQEAWRTRSGVYYDTLLTSSGCDSLIITHLTVAEPVYAPTVVANGNRLSSNVPGDTYYWLLDGRPLADTTATLTAELPGSYSVAVRSGACPSPFSELYHHQPVVTSLNDGPGPALLRVYRPDFGSAVVMEVTLPTPADAHLYVHDVRGNRVFERVVTLNAAARESWPKKYQQRIFLADQPSGVYVATLLAEGKRHSIKIIW